jgi:hypothetical protein
MLRPYRTRSDMGGWHNDAGARRVNMAGAP